METPFIDSFDQTVVYQKLVSDITTFIDSNIVKLLITYSESERDEIVMRLVTDLTKDVNHLYWLKGNTTTNQTLSAKEALHNLMVVQAETYLHTKVKLVMKNFRLPTLSFPTKPVTVPKSIIDKIPIVSAYAKEAEYSAEATQSSEANHSKDWLSDGIKE